jgi:hypothetical protein
MDEPVTVEAVFYRSPKRASADGSSETPARRAQSASAVDQLRTDQRKTASAEAG